MQFYYIDPSTHVHRADICHAHSIIDIDIHWLNIGHLIFHKRMHGMECLEKLSEVIPDDHQFTFRQWYEARSKQTHCMWYSIPKKILASDELKENAAQSLVFAIPKYFPGTLRNKNVLVFVEIKGCEMVAGYSRGLCVCLKKLPESYALNLQHEWQHIQQAYPQWTFDHSVYFTSRHGVENNLIQTHQQTIHMEDAQQIMKNRIMLYGLN